MTTSMALTKYGFGVYALSNSTTNIRIDSIYLMLGTTNTDENACELSFGTTTAGDVLRQNPSAPGSDRIQALTSDGTYLYAAGYDSVGIDKPVAHREAQPL
jgi:hypothetical protein